MYFYKGVKKCSVQEIANITWRLVFSFALGLFEDHHFQVSDFTEEASQDKV